MSVPLTTRDHVPSEDSPVFELWNYCPYLTCGERTSVGPEFRCCGQCGSAFNVCSQCRATNRLLSGFCRGCGQKLLTESWPLEPGLKSNPIQRQAITSLDELQSPFPVRLGCGVQVSPIATDGLLVISQTDGGVVLLSEHTGNRIGALSIAPAVAVTPAIQSGTLFVPAGNILYVFDIARFLDQPSLQELSPIWAFECGGPISQPLLVDETAVYLLTNRTHQVVLYAVSQEDGVGIWPEALTFDTNQTTPPLLVENRIVLITAEGHVSLIGAASGTVEQTFSLNRRIDLEASPAVVDNRIVLSEPGGHVFELVLGGSGPLINSLYDQRSRISSIAASAQFIALGHLSGLTLISSRGHLIWISDTNESISTTPIIAGESVFALDDAGNALLFDVLKANPVRRMKLLSGEVGMSPLLTQSRIVVVAADGEVVALEWH